MAAARPTASTSVVVLSQRPGDWLAPCLTSLEGQADEVVLVDNGSEGGEVSALGRSFGARVVRFPRNLGFAAGVNAGVARARGDLVALLNDDAVAGPGWLAAAEAVLSDPTVAAVTPKVLLDGWYRQVVLHDQPFPAPGDHRRLGRKLGSVRVEGTEVLERLAGIGVHALEHGPGQKRWRWTNPGEPFYVPADPGAEILLDGEPAPEGPTCRLVNKAGSYLCTDGMLGDFASEAPDDGRWDTPAERFFASATALVARAETMARVGPLAEPLFAYYEDGDWSWRARLGGLRLVYDPSSVVEHRQSATSGGATSAWVRKVARRNKLLVMARNAPLGVAWAQIRADLAAGPAEGARRATLARLPWAIGTRGRLARRWVVSPEQVWERWAGVDTTWDAGPYRQR